MSLKAKLREDLTESLEPIVDGFYRARKVKNADLEEFVAQLMSSGVDTAAGRLGALGDGTQVLADLFALKAKTGRWGYNPYAPPRIDPKFGTLTSWPPQVLQARIAFDEAAQHYLAALIRGLSEYGHAFLI